MLWVRDLYGTLMVCFEAHMSWNSIFDKLLSVFLGVETLVAKGVQLNEKRVDSV